MERNIVFIWEYSLAQEEETIKEKGKSTWEGKKWEKGLKIKENEEGETKWRILSGRVMQMNFVYSDWSDIKGPTKELEDHSTLLHRISSLTYTQA